MPPFGPTMKIFYRRLCMKMCVFLPFSSKNCKIQQCLMVFFHTNTICDSKSPCEIAWLHLIWRCDFLRFRISEKMSEFAAFIEHSKAKSVSASGGSRPWLCPWTPLGAPPPDLRYRLALCALAMAPLCQILNTPLLVAPDPAGRAYRLD